MIQFQFNMPLILMGFYGGAMVLVVLLLRLTMGKWLPKRVMPALWALVLVRLLVPFSISSPLSLPVPSFLEGLSYGYGYAIGDSYVTFHESEPTRAIAGDIAILAEGQTLSIESGYQPEFSSRLVGLTDIIPNDNASGAVAFVSGQAEVLDRSLDRLWDQVTVVQEGDWSWKNLLPDLRGMQFSGVWLAGMAVMALVLCWRYFKSRSGFQGVYELDENQTVRETLVKCRVGAKAYSCDTVKSPVAAGILSPVILLPASLDFGNQELVRHILTHEAMHIRRKDNLMKLVMMAALCLHWYNPLVWVMVREFCRDMESACDEAALALLGAEESSPYAQSLLAMAVPGLNGGLFASAFSRTEVERRVKGVLAYKKPGFFTLTAAAVLLVSTTVAFATCGQGFFDDTLSSWCYSGNTYIARATLVRPIDLGSSRNRARSLANHEIYEVLEDATDDIRVDALEKNIQKRLASVFGVEPGAFKVEIAPMVDREKLMEQYKESGLEKDENGFWRMNGELVHILEDELTGEYFSNSQGKVDVYVIRDEQYKLLRIECYDYYRF